MQEIIPIVIRTGYWQGENRLKCLDGRIVEVNQAIFPIHDANGNLMTIATITVDITARKAMEHVLKHNEERYRRMFERVNLPKLIIDPQTARILDANPAAIKFYGYPIETLTAMTMLEINIAEPQEIIEKMTEVINSERNTCDFRQRMGR